MPDYFEDADLNEMHVAATHAHHAGFTRVEIDPLHAITLINELKGNRRALAYIGQTDRAKAYALVERELRAAGIRRIDLSDYVVCASRPGEGVVFAERAPTPTLISAVDLLGPKEEG